VFICYLDESGAPEPAGTSHFVLLGLAIPVTAWKSVDAQIEAIKTRHRLSNTEIHTAWMIRKYPDQHRVKDFKDLGDTERRAAVVQERKADLAAASMRGPRAVKDLARNYSKTADYIHLTFEERVAALREIADLIGANDSIRIFGEAAMKSANSGTPQDLFTASFEQVVSRFHHYLEAVGGNAIGLLVQDNNETAAKHLTSLMRLFHKRGTKWVQIPRIIETPLFVDSKLTGMVQLADLVAYATRRFVESGESDLFDRVYNGFDRVPNGKLVGLRHYTSKHPCNCRICIDHGRTQ